ncbi:MAG TPA: hypothetical protein VMU30_02140 [Bacteroidota bacterium]|nr:hypothetical protein [Bacteroidota bacterium]
MGLLEEQNDSFIELTMHERAQMPPSVKKGNILKAVKSESLNSTSSADASLQNQEPEVIVHQHAEKIESLEFRCPCGRHTEVKIEYDGD